MNKDIFKAYDIRGIYPTEINEETVYLIGKAYAQFLKPKTVVLGRDVRQSGDSLWKACAKGLTEMGVDVYDVGVISTDMLYFAVAAQNFDGGLTITASHNPSEYNGLKLVRAGAAPISSDTGINEIRDLAEKNEFKNADKVGAIKQLEILDDYVAKVLSFVDIDAIKPMKVVVNPNFGAAGRVIEKIAKILNIELVKLNFEPDGTFPKGRPDPMIPELRLETRDTVLQSGADLGIAWDADADRIFWFDEKGRFVDGYYEGCVLSKNILRKYPGAKVIHDPRLTWAAIDVIKENGGIPLINKVGHAFIKERMRKDDVAFAFENTAHIYFRDFYFCDNGMIPFVMILEEMSKTGSKLSEIVDPIRFKYPVSEEVNFKVKDPKAVIKDLERNNKGGKLEYIDGLSVEYPDWRFNVRMSNTEPLVRLNVEAHDRGILDKMKSEIVKDIKKDLAEI